MHRVRSNIRQGSRLALFALAVQIILSFGHVHLYGVSPDALTQASITPAAMTNAPLGAPGSRAPIDKSDGAVDAFCLICASIQLIAGSAVPGAPVLLLPAALGVIEPRAFAEDLFAALPLNPFQARAPPPL